MEAVAKSGFAAHVPGLPPDIPVDQVYVVPPDWAVCALTDRLGVSARTRYLRDKVSSAQYRTAKYLGDQLVSFITPSQLKSSRSLVSCAKGAQNAVEGYPDLDGLGPIRAGHRDGHRMLGHLQEAAGERRGGPNSPV